MRTLAKLQATTIRVFPQAYAAVFCILGGAYLSLHALMPGTSAIV